MAKYASDANLIKGAATAYKNYDNVAGMYSGLDKVTKAGTDMMGEAVKGYEAEQEKIKKEQEKAKKEQEAAKAKQDAIEKEWDNAADKVILSSGSLGDKLYNFTTDEVGEDLKKLYLEGVNEKDPKKRREAMRQLQAHSTWVQNHKQMNLDYAHMVKGKNADGSDNPGMSKYFTTNPKGMEEAHTMKQIMDQKYTHTSRDEETGDIIFHIPADDEKGYPAKTITSKEYNEMVIPRNYSITANTEKLQKSVNQSENLDEDVARQSISNVIDKMGERDFVASMYDDVSGKNLIKMLDDRGENLDQEIISSINSKAWDADEDGILDPKERKNFIDAVTNPENDFFDLETSKKIMADQIFNGVKNRHAKHWERENDKNKDKSKGLNLSYGFRNWGQMQGDYDLIKSGKEGDTVNAPYNGEMRTFTRKADGRFSHKHAGGEIIRTPEQMRQLKELTHLGSIEDPAGGYTASETTEEAKAVEDEAKKQFPRPGRLIITQSFGIESSKRVINKLTELYKDYPGFTFDRAADKQLSILAPDGVTEIFVDMDKSAATFNAGDSQDKIRDFIYENSKEKANTEFNSTTP